MRSRSLQGEVEESAEGSARDVSELRLDEDDDNAGRSPGRPGGRRAAAVHTYPGRPKLAPFLYRVASPP